MSETRLVDYSFARPKPSTIKNYGYVGVVRYLGGSAAKQLTKAEAATLHAADLAIALVFEGGAKRATQGHAAGAADAKSARAKAAALGYPAECPIFFAVDFDASAAVVADYFAGVVSIMPKRAGIYGGLKVMNIDVPWKWQTAAWSGGVLSPEAHLYQRAKPVGKVPGGCDQNVVCKPLPMWAEPSKFGGAPAIVTIAPPSPKPAPKPTPKPKPKPKPTPAPVPTPVPVSTKKNRWTVLAGDTNLDLHDVGWRTYLTTVYGALLCWSVRLPAIGSHAGRRLIDALLGWGVTFANPRVMTRIGRPIGFDHTPIYSEWSVGKVTVRHVHQSGNDKKTSGKWQLTTAEFVSWLLELSHDADVVTATEALQPRVLASLRKGLGKCWTVRRRGEFLIATRNAVVTDANSGGSWVVSAIANLAGWRQMHAASFRYKVAGRDGRIVVTHMPAGVQDGKTWKPGKQTDAHKAGDVALAKKIRSWL